MHVRRVAYVLATKNFTTKLKKYIPMHSNIYKNNINLNEEQINPQN